MPNGQGLDGLHSLELWSNEKSFVPDGNGTLPAQSVCISMEISLLTTIFVLISNFHLVMTR
jgi:hypothetical protein